MTDTSVTNLEPEPVRSSATMQAMAIVEHPVDIRWETLISPTPVAAAKIK